jgi:hypothetical protein
MPAPPDMLVDAFVATVAQSDDSLWYSQAHPPAPEFHQGVDPQDWDRILWAPARVATARSHLRPILDRLERPLPRLYERLVLNYRWPEVFLHRIRLKGNGPGPDLSDLTGELFADPAFNEILIPQGFLPFAFGAERDEWSYDPVCFDLNGLNADGDCRILRFEHESILSCGKVGEVRTLWPSLNAWMADTVEAESGNQRLRRP